MPDEARNPLSEYLVEVRVVGEDKECLLLLEHRLFERPQLPASTLWQMLEDAKRRFEELDPDTAAVEFSAEFSRIDPPTAVEYAEDGEERSWGYPEYQRLDAWEVVDEELTALVHNDDLIPTTHRYLIVGRHREGTR